MSEITGGDIAAVADELSGSSAPAQDASPASTPESADASTPAPTAATVPSSETDPELSTDTANTGGIPVDRHKVILENARAKAREEALNEWRQQHGWAEQIDRSQLQEWSQTAQQMAADPVGFLQKFQAELLNHPTYGPQLKSHAARTLGQRQAAQQDDAEPQADLQTEDGTPVYSAKQLAAREAWKERQLEKRWNERLAPLQETHAQMQEARQRELIDHASNQFAQHQLVTIKALPHYEEFKSEIRDKFAAMPQPEHPMGYAVNLRDAYLQVVIPKLSQRERSQVLAEMQTKATATTASPARPSTSAPMRDADRPIAELLAEEMARTVR